MQTESVTVVVGALAAGGVLTRLVDAFSNRRRTSVEPAQVLAQASGQITEQYRTFAALVIEQNSKLTAQIVELTTRLESSESKWRHVAAELRRAKREISVLRGVVEVHALQLPPIDDETGEHDVVDQAVSDERS